MHETCRPPTAHWHTARTPSISICRYKRALQNSFARVLRGIHCPNTGPVCKAYARPTYYLGNHPSDLNQLCRLTIRPPPPPGLYFVDSKPLLPPALTLHPAAEWPRCETPRRQPVVSQRDGRLQRIAPPAAGGVPSSWHGCCRAVVGHE